MSVCSSHPQSQFPDRVWLGPVSFARRRKGAEKVLSAECIKVWSVGFRMYNVESEDSGVWSVGIRVDNVECEDSGVWSVECGVYCVQCGGLGLWSVEYGVLVVQCGV